MSDAIKLLFFITILEGLSSSFGGLIGASIKAKSKNMIACLFELSAGMMTAIVCFSMLPESFNIASIWYGIMGVIIGVAIIYFLDKKIENSNDKNNIKKMSNTSLIIIIAMAGHNIMEGIAVGAGTSYSITLGVTIILSIFLHNIPEGMIVGITMKLENKKFFDIIKYSALVGMPTGIGAFLGNIVGSVSNEYVAISLSLSAGAMLYIVACDLIPSSKNMSQNKKVSMVYILGIILGILATRI
ncbi:Zinc transporter ZupT [compost metagenome]